MATQPPQAKQDGEGPPSPKPMPTERLYFHDTYQFEGTATVLSVNPVEAEKPATEDVDEQQQQASDQQKHEEEKAEPGQGEKPRRFIVLLNQTLFHPQGGGQPSDIGRITKDDVVFEVQHVQLSKERHGVVEHIGIFQDEQRRLSAGDNVDMKVDEQARRTHAKLHSAGHLLDAAMQQIGRTDLDPSKGYHFPDGNAYVEYAGAIPAEEREEVVSKLNAACSGLIDQQTDVSVQMYDVEGSELPRRIVTIGGCECPCGGTHVKNTSELQGLKVTRIKKNKKRVKVYYTMDGAEEATKQEAGQ